MNNCNDKPRWVALFSQSGQEIWSLYASLGRAPDLIITNQVSQARIYPPLLERFQDRLVYITQNTVEAYKNILRETDLVTLHGYLRIIPAETCNTFNIYNGHPGLITLYPDLKGYNPQEKACKKEYKIIGSVVHKCVAEVDEGPIIVEKRYTITVEEREQYKGNLLQLYINLLRDTSLVCWREFFKNYFKDYLYEK